MDDFSAWNFANNFRLHEAACLIAGVMPVSKKHPTTEELPAQARPILVRLISAYCEWALQQRYPGRPKSICLEGCLNIDGSVPELDLESLTGELASREALHRFLTELGDVGHKSGYDFGPIKRGEALAAGAVLESAEPAEIIQQLESSAGTAAKLSASQKAEIVRLYRAGKSESALARDFDVHRKTITRALVAAGIKGAPPRTPRTKPLPTRMK